MQRASRGDEPLSQGETTVKAASERQGPIGAGKRPSQSRLRYRPIVWAQGVFGHEVSGPPPGRRLRALAGAALAGTPHRLFVEVTAADLRDEQLYLPSAPLSRVASQVILQLLERPTIEDPAELAGRLTRLCDLGYRLSVGDFGAGDGGLSAVLLDAERALMEAKKQAHWINGTDWIAVVQKIHRKVGVALVERWEMPAPVRNAVRDCEEYDNADRLSVANVVRFANAVVKQRDIYIGPVNAEDNDAMVMIGRSLLNLDDEMVERATAGLSKIGGLL
jgi:hypothetical protein